MKCANCGHEFPKGNFCPKCGTKVMKDEPVFEPVAQSAPPTPPQAPSADNNTAFSNTFTPQPEDENPYEEFYNTPQAPVNEPVYQTVPPVPQPVPQPEPQPEPQPVPQPVPQPQYQQPYYPPQNKKGWTPGKIVALVAGILAGLILYTVITNIAVPMGILSCVSNNSVSVNADKTPHAVTDVVRSGNFEYSLSDITYTDTYNNVKRTDGKTYLMFKVNVKNIGANRDFDSSSYTLYADDVACKQYEDEADESFYQPDEIDPGKSVQEELVYIIPSTAVSVSLSVTNDNSYELFTEQNQFTFTIR